MNNDALEIGSKGELFLHIDGLYINFKSTSALVTYITKEGNIYTKILLEVLNESDCIWKELL